MNFHLEILSGNQKKVVRNLSFLKTSSYYLGGGTALALQLGHRTSLDFDFYSPYRLENKDLEKLFKAHFPKIILPKVQPEDTFQMRIFKINLSFFYYPYKLVGQLVDFPAFKLASLEDIAAMKVAAVVQRAKQRDFIDLFYLIKKIGLKKVIKATYEKYPWYEENNQIIFKALTYFEEADRDEEIQRIDIIDKTLSWTRVKETLLIEVKKYREKI